MENLLTDGCKFVKIYRQASAFYQETLLFASGIHFCQRLRKAQRLLWKEGLGM
jgi:hypothetical protein